MEEKREGILPEEKTSWNGDERRLLARVSDCFPVFFSKMDEGWYQRNKELFVTRKTIERENLSFIDPSMGRFSSTRTQTIDPMLFRMLIEINRKLDILLKAVPQTEEIDGDRQYEGLCTEISGQGMKLQCTIPLREKDILNMFIPLPPIHPVTVNLVGLVKRSTSIRDEFTNQETHEYAIEFLAMNDEDKEEVIAYTFKRQREIINLQKKESKD
jgi:hypothetical protein